MAVAPTVFAELNGIDFGEIQLTYGAFAPHAGEGGGWMIEVPALMRILRAAERGDIGISDATELIMGAVGEFSKLSGCCIDCDGAIDDYAAALEAYEKAVAEHEERERLVTPESHPYILSGSAKLHKATCGTDPHLPEIVHPGKSLHDFVHRGRADLYGARISTRGHSRRMTADQVAQWLVGRAKVNRCKLCAPALPAAFSSEASDVEASGSR
jgi:hypothetical protein